MDRPARPLDPPGARRGSRRGSLLWGCFWLLALAVLGTVGWIFHQLVYAPGGMGSAYPAPPLRGGSLSEGTRPGPVPLPPGWGELQQRVLRSLVEGGGSENATMIVFQATW